MAYAKNAQMELQERYPTFSQNVEFSEFFDEIAQKQMFRCSTTLDGQYFEGKGCQKKLAKSDLAENAARILFRKPPTRTTNVGQYRISKAICSQPNDYERLSYRIEQVCESAKKNIKTAETMLNEILQPNGYVITQTNAYHPVYGGRFVWTKTIIDHGKEYSYTSPSMINKKLAKQVAAETVLREHFKINLDNLTLQGSRLTRCAPAERILTPIPDEIEEEIPPTSAAPDEIDYDSPLTDEDEIEEGDYKKAAKELKKLFGIKMPKPVQLNEGSTAIETLRAKIGDSSTLEFELRDEDDFGDGYKLYTYRLMCNGTVYYGSADTENEAKERAAANALRKIE